MNDFFLFACDSLSLLHELTEIRSVQNGTIVFPYFELNVGAEYEDNNFNFYECSRLCLLLSLCKYLKLLVNIPILLKMLQRRCKGNHFCRKKSWNCGTGLNAIVCFDKPAEEYNLHKITVSNFVYA